MRGPFPETRIIFTEEFRQQILNPGFVFFTAVILVSAVVTVVMMLAATQMTYSILESPALFLDDEVSEPLKRTGYVARRASCPALDCRTRRNATTTAPRVFKRSGKARLTPSSVAS